MNLLEEIKNVNEIDDIKRILLYDVKCEIDYNLVNKIEDNLKNNTYIKNEFEKGMLNYKENDNNIKNWLRYRICFADLKPGTFDCDKTANVKEILVELLQKYFNNVINGDDRDVYVDSITLETDTINSYQRTFGSYYRSKKNGIKYSEYVENEKWPVKPFYRDFYLLKEFDNLFASVKDSSSFRQLEIFARLTHTIGNFILVPSNYNSFRGLDSTIHDDWMNTLIDIQTRNQIYDFDCKNNFDWYRKNLDFLLGRNYFDYDINVDNLFMINKDILLRGIEMIEIISDKKFTDFKEKIFNFNANELYEFVCRL